MIHEQERMLGLVKEVLGDDFMHLEVVHYDLHEDFAREQTHIRCTIEDTQGEKTEIEGAGVGLIDAFFHALLNRLSQDYPSLNSIIIEKFTVSGKLSSGREASHSDAIAVVNLGIRNSRGSHFDFEHESRSVTRSGIEATLRAAEYFVNSERAFIAAFRALKAARERNRQDLIGQYTDMMSQLVKNTSYSETIEQIRSELGS